MNKLRNIRKTNRQSINRLIDESKNGFTLVELLVVVAMIVLITGAVSTSMAGAFRRARIQKATSEVKMISQAILAYENYNKKHELPVMEDNPGKEFNIQNFGFLLGTGEKSAANTEIPVLIQAALNSSGVMRDPWGTPYYVKIRKGTIKSLNVGNIRTGYYLPNFYRLSKDERK